jgi:hypothetical protein
MKFQHVPVSDLRGVWPCVRSNLLHILDKSPEDWIPEDVYTEIVTTRSLLFMAMENGHPVGGAVVRPQGKTLLTWAAWGVHGLRDDAMSGLREIARNLQCTELMFETKRRGWDKVAPKLGFRPRTWIAEV